MQISEQILSMKDDCVKIRRDLQIGRASCRERV